MTLIDEFVEEIQKVLKRLREQTRPSRQVLTENANHLISWRQERNLPGLWEKPPLMLTATVDDGWGHGLEIIHLYAEAAGLRVKPLGLMLAPEIIIAECALHNPDILGITVLQFDSETALQRIRLEIPAKTRIVAGGPLFSADPEFAGLCGIDMVAKDAMAFMDFLLTFPRHELPKSAS
jgi:methylmalonyl-CoA mutase cobalamin-binding subunit